MTEWPMYIAVGSIAVSLFLAAMNLRRVATAIEGINEELAVARSEREKERTAP